MAPSLSSRDEGMAAVAGTSERIETVAEVTDEDVLLVDELSE